MEKIWKSIKFKEGWIEICKINKKEYRLVFMDSCDGLEVKIDKKELKEIVDFLNQQLVQI